MSSWLSFEMQRAEDELQAASKIMVTGDPMTIEANSEDSQKFFATHARWTAKEPTGAFDNPLTSFRLMPIPSRWPEIIATVGGLYGSFVGIPALAGAWALWKILHGGVA